MPSDSTEPAPNPYGDTAVPDETLEGPHVPGAPPVPDIPIPPPGGFPQPPPGGTMDAAMIATAVGIGLAAAGAVVAAPVVVAGAAAAATAAFIMRTLEPEVEIRAADETDDIPDQREA